MSKNTSPNELLLNLTPHNIVVYPNDETKKLIMYAKSGVVARLNTRKQAILEVLEDGCPVYEPQDFSSISPKYPPKDKFKKSMRGVIVSMPVAQWLCDTDGNGLDRVYAEWGEIFCADTGPDGAIRDDKGIIIGTKRLVRYLST